jgi:tetratricopeptide (TPR) repeat protein
MDDKIGILQSLVEDGRLTEVLEQMRELWPPDQPLSEEDLLLVGMFLRASRDMHGERAWPLYRAYETGIKNVGSDFPSLRSLWVRAPIVETYEGPKPAIEWLQQLQKGIAPPDDGIADLLIGRILLQTGDAAAARPHLRQALQRSLSGIEWYRLEAIGAMAQCLVRLGEPRLAFEYTRLHHIESYKIGKIHESDLFKAASGTALLYGEIDYLIALKRNIAQRRRESGHFSHAALEQADVGFRLGQLGSANEAALALEQAAADARRGSHRGDPAFAATTSLLGRYLATSPLTAEELSTRCDELIRWGPIVPSTLIHRSRDFLRERVEDAGLIEECAQACRRYVTASAFEEKVVLLIVTYFIALLGRFAFEHRLDEYGGALYECLLSIEEPRDAIFQFAAENYAEELLRLRQFERAERVARTALAQRPNLFAHERFALRQCAARASLGRGDARSAYADADRALLEWSRVLGGIYEESHKTAWIARGAACVRCAIAALAEPSEWLDEPMRRRELFRFIELGKARLTADLANHAGTLDGVYFVPAMWEQRRDPFDAAREQSDDWLVPVLLQLSAFNDGISTVVHQDDGSTSRFLSRDVSALRGLIHLPIDDEKRLYVSAQALYFDRGHPPKHDDLDEEIERSMRGEP